MPLPMYQEEKVRLGGVHGVKYILAVAAGKGGVGKSSVTVNVALGMKELGLKVGILDADLYGPSMRKMLKEDRLPRRLDQEMLPALAEGISVISMAHFREEGEASVVRAPIANGMIQQFIHQVDWGDLDVLLVDCPPGTGDIPLTVTQQLPLTGALIVTTPQEVSLLDVVKAMNMFKQVQVPILGVLENMSYYQDPVDSEKRTHIFGKGGGRRLAEEQGYPFLGEVPLDPLLCECNDAGRSLFSNNEDHPISKLFLSLAKRVWEQLEVLANPEKQGLREFEMIWVQMPPEKHLEGVICEVPQEDFVFPREIRQRDNHTFTIVWTDGIGVNYSLAELQQRCPCAACTESPMGPIKPTLRANRIISVGRYALRIDFSQGCSNGIYNYHFLRSLERKEQS